MTPDACAVVEVPEAGPWAKPESFDVVVTVVTPPFGVVICFDRHFPESFAACQRDGAEIVIIPTANHKEEDLELFGREIRGAASQNNFYVAMCNRVGTEKEMVFAGESLVVDPHGKVVSKADDREQILSVALPPRRPMTGSVPYTIQPCPR